MSEEGKKRILGFQDGEWFHSGHEDFEDIAEVLVSKGFTEAEALDLLERAYRVVANEYGD